MKKQQRQTAKSAVRPSRTPIIILVMIVILAAAAITVVSRQVGKSTNSNALTSAATADTSKRYVTIKVAGRDLQVDSQTGRIRPLSPEEAQRLADGLKKMLNKSTAGLVRERHADGSVSMDLQGRFQNVMVAKRNADGAIEQACIDEPEAAAKFFGIDPRLLGVERRQVAASQTADPPARKAIR